MPANVVKTAKDEERWKECKASVSKSHPDLDENDDRYYALVMGCFQRRKKNAVVGKTIKGRRGK